MFKVNNKSNRTASVSDAVVSMLVTLLLMLLTNFAHFSSALIVAFEHVFVCWEVCWPKLFRIFDAFSLSHSLYWHWTRTYFSIILSNHGNIYCLMVILLAQKCAKGRNKIFKCDTGGHPSRQIHWQLRN